MGIRTYSLYKTQSKIRLYNSKNHTKITTSYPRIFNIIHIFFGISLGKSLILLTSSTMTPLCNYRKSVEKTLSLTVALCLPVAQRLKPRALECESGGVGYTMRGLACRQMLRKTFPNHTYTNQ